MTSYEGIGAEHSETTEALLMGVLRKEWDFKGAITTDYVSYTTSDAIAEGFIRSGGSLTMGKDIGLGPSDWTYDSMSSLRFQNRLKQVAKEILWTWLRAEYNARYYEANPDADDTFVSATSIPSWVWWKPALTSINVAAGFGIGLWIETILVNIFLPKNKKKEELAQEGGK